MTSSTICSVYPHASCLLLTAFQELDTLLSNVYSGKAFRCFGNSICCMVGLPCCSETKGGGCTIIDLRHSEGRAALPPGERLEGSVVWTVLRLMSQAELPDLFDVLQSDSGAAHERQVSVG